MLRDNFEEHVSACQSSILAAFLSQNQFSGFDVPCMQNPKPQDLNQAVTAVQGYLEFRVCS